MVTSDTSVLLVSGTADSGRAVARKVDRAGGTVGFTYNTGHERANSLINDLEGDHSMWQCDVTDQREVDAVVQDAFDEFGQVDAVVYTVGVIARAEIDELDTETWQEHLDANVTGAYNLIHAVAPHLKAQGDGSIVALSASPGVIRSSNLAAYDASKQGLEALVHEAARDLGPYGVQANVVAPGFIRDPDQLTDEQREDLLQQVPYERITRPDDIADACLFLCSDEAKAITGAVLPVDSGLAL